MLLREIPWELPLSHIFQGQPDYPYALGAKLPDVFPTSFDLDLAWILADLSQLVYLQDFQQIEQGVGHLPVDEIQIQENQGMRFLLLTCRNCVILVFRGTLVERMDHILTDLRLLPVQYGRRGRVHEGFLSAAKHLWPQLHARLKKLDREMPLLFTGHSLGAALAQLAHEHCSRRFLHTYLYTFGAPRVGDGDFVKACKGVMHRVVNNNDLVAQLPPPGYYHHAGNLVYIDSDGKIQQQPDLWLRIKEMFRGNHQFFQDMLDQWAEGRFSIPPMDALLDHSPLHYSIRLWNARCSYREP